MNKQQYVHIRRSLREHGYLSAEERKVADELISHALRVDSLAARAAFICDNNNAQYCLFMRLHLVPLN